MIAVSFCNAYGSGAVYILDNDFEVIKKIPTSNGTTGIAKVENGLLVVSRGFNIIKIGSNLERTEEYKTGLQDMHSILVIGEELFIAATATDTIAKIGLRGGGLKSGDADIIFSEGRGLDSLHINSLAEYKGDLIYSCFGECEKDKKNAIDGGIVSLKNGWIKKGIQQPHSLKVVGEDIYFLESKKGTFYKNFEPQFDLKGYVRGFDILDGDFLIGSSKSRNETVSQTEMAMIFRTNKEGATVDLVEFPEFEEIYDIVVFDEF